MTLDQVIFDPLLAWPLICALGALALAMAALAYWRGLSGWALRGLAALVLLVALANPALQREDRAPLSDIVIVVVDESASQQIADRAAQTAEALAGIEARIARLGDTEMRVVRLADAPGDGGTLMMAALAEAMAEEPRARIAGLFLLTDGQVHDMALAPDLPAPLHVLLSGHDDDWDRRLVIRNAPAFAILGETTTLTLRVEDQGEVPSGVAGSASLTITVNGKNAQTVSVPVGEDMEFPLVLPHGGMNVLQFEVAASEGELTTRNNAAVVQINGVRDRLRVLLVSGEPHAGERVWRNLLKSDSAVDLVHFTILRPPEKQDGVPVSELSLIAFPTRELFIEKINEFDLIIFDRYRRRGILPLSYLDNVRSYVLAGGTVLVAAGPEFGSADSLYRSPLADILPVRPTSRVIDGGYRPEVTELGARHPVTEGLEGAEGPDGPTWGRWFRQIEMEATAGQVVMTGPEARPLLVLNRVGEGRVAMLGSDQAWLWGRGYEGGGPQLELLRRLAHWMMKEPELEEEALTASAEAEVMIITRRSLADSAAPVTVTAPDGGETVVELSEATPGQFTGTYRAEEMGLYQLSDGTLDAVMALGPAAPREFEETIASGAVLSPLVETGRGRILSIEDGLPDIRHVRAGRTAGGRGWVGLTPREAYVSRDLRVSTLLPAWALLLLAAALIVAAWLWEGRCGSARV